MSGTQQKPAEHFGKSGAKKGRPVWDQQPSEPYFWYSRFHRFLTTGIYRSLLGVYNRERAEREPGCQRKNRTPSSWEHAAKQWRWRERADAYDKHMEAEARKGRELHAQAEVDAREAERRQWSARLGIDLD